MNVTDHMLVHQQLHLLHHIFCCAISFWVVSSNCAMLESAIRFELGDNAIYKFSSVVALYDFEYPEVADYFVEFPSHLLC